MLALLELVFAEGDSSDSVTQPIEELPAFGANGTTITWVSSNTDILSNDGQILDRSACGDSDVLLTLTATVSRGEASDTKEFPLLIKKDPLSKAVEFTTTHFSQYAVGYNEVTFDDVGENLWYSEKGYFHKSTGSPDFIQPSAIMCMC